MLKSTFRFCVSLVAFDADFVGNDDNDNDAKKC